MKKELKKENRGITLIALVVTIIVLIILATVSISMVTGENGLIKKAEQAREAYENSAQRENANMNEMLKEMAQAEGTIGPNGLPTVNTLTTIQEENVKAEDRQGNLITVPRGFKVKAEYGTSVENGIVIEDNQGNQFVWVPCKEGEYKKHQYVTTTATDTSSTADTGNGKWKTYYYRQWSDWTDEGVNETSVKDNGGFYVARYEAGVPSTATEFYVDKDTESKTYVQDKGTNTGRDVSNLAPVSKAGNQSWNYITQIKAKTVSANMYKDAESNYGVRSQLIDGVAWDRIAEWMGKEDSKIATDSTTIGNYANNYGGIKVANTLYAEHLYKVKVSGNTNVGWCPGTTYKVGTFTSGYKDPWSGPFEGYTGYDSSQDYKYRHYVEMATGASDVTKVKNIYDMAGNMWEWTTEEGYHGAGSGTQYAVLRGGCFSGNGSVYPLSCRHGNIATTDSYLDVGFRVVLYVK